MPTWLPVVSALIGAFTGALTTFFLNHWLVPRRRSIAHWRALEAEAGLCRENAGAFLNDTKAAPLYRLPLLTYEHSFPQLLLDGNLRRTEVEAITKFFTQVDTLNRGLDQAHAVRNNQEELANEHGRNRMKAELIISSGDYYKALRAVFDKRLR